MFVNHKQEAQSLGHFLKMHGISSNSIHGDKSQDEREQALWAFKHGQISVLVATDVAARGLDIPNVAHVIQYDIAGSIDDYVHRIGRTGRAGNTGNAIGFVNDRCKGICPELVEVLKESNQVCTVCVCVYVRVRGGSCCPTSPRTLYYRKAPSAVGQCHCFCSDCA